MIIPSPKSADPAARPPARPSRPSTTDGAGMRKGSTLPWIRAHELLVYAVVAYGISWSLLIGGYCGTRVGLLDAEGLPVALMVQVAAAGPLIAALGLIICTRGRSGLASLGRSLIRWRVAPWWYALIFLGIPSIMILPVWGLHPEQITYALDQNWPRLLVGFPVTVLAVAAFTGLAEEPGWRGYAQPVANRRHPPLVAALVVSAHLGDVASAQRAVRAGTDRDAPPSARHHRQRVRVGMGLQRHRRERPHRRAAARCAERDGPHGSRAPGEQPERSRRSRSTTSSQRWCSARSWLSWLC